MTQQSPQALWLVGILLKVECFGDVGADGESFFGGGCLQFVEGFL